MFQRQIGSGGSAGAAHTTPAALHLDSWSSVSPLMAPFPFRAVKLQAACDLASTTSMA